MRIGLMIGPEKGRQRDKVAQLIADAQAAERDGFSSIWMPQIPGEFDALTAITLMGHATRRIELGTAVLPIQTRHPIAMAQEVLSNQAVCGGRFTLGIGTSHHWVVNGMLGLPYERPAVQMRSYLEVLNAALRGDAQIDVENEHHRVHSPMDVTDRGPNHVLLAALGPVMLRLAGEHASGTILWLADERAVAEHIVPRITRAATAAGRPAPRVVAGVPIVLCAKDEIDGARAWANKILGHAEYSPNYERLLEHGDAKEVGDILAAGDESVIVARMRAFRDAGATDFAVRILAYGRDREARIESRRRTLALVSSLGSEL